MVGLSKIVTVLVTVMAVICLAGFASPALAQTYGDQMYGDPIGDISLANVGGKSIPQAANVGANANVGMAKGLPPANVGMAKGLPQTANVGANANIGLGKGMGKGGYGGGYGASDMGMGDED